MGLLLSVGAFFLWQSISGVFDTPSGIPSGTDLINQTNYLTDFEEAGEKQKGAHVFGRIDSTNFQFLTRNNIEWVTLVTWSSQDDFDSPTVKHHHGDSVQMLRSDSNWIKRIERVRAAGFKVFFKPHIWIDTPSDGKWRADIFPSNEENWEIWKNSYREYIIRYAKISEQAQAEMFCIGAELSRLSLEKSAFWRELIKEVRSIYSGKITYAANWNEEYDKVNFWDELDYIGIQAYFPLSKNECPSVGEVSRGWNKHLPAIESISRKYQRKILFTELGYKSTTDGAIKPWEWMDNPYGEDKTYSDETQANCYQAFFNTVWKKEWFAGAHIWSIHEGYLPEEHIDRENKDFTPQGKQAEDIIAKGFQ